MMLMMRACGPTPAEGCLADAHDACFGAGSVTAHADDARPGLLGPKAVPADAHDARLGAGSVTADAHDARLCGCSGRRPFLPMLMMHASGLEASRLMLMTQACGPTPAEGSSC